LLSINIPIPQYYHFFANLERENKPCIFEKNYFVKGKLYLIPNLLGEGTPDDVIPQGVLQVIRTIRYFIVEDIRTARRFLAKVKSQHKIDDMVFYELNEHTALNTISQYLDPINEENIGIISEAGVPGVADPGADIVRIAHTKGIQVVPLTGPSSILMAVMAAGLNGQSFAFNGYLPIKNPDRTNKIKFFEKRAITENQTQLFIETPYRNMQLLEDILTNCLPTTMLGLAVNITQPDELICTLPIAQWKTKKVDLHKKPAIFLIGK
jgi:16S rRNA (cytidine1402-2'-O)-methyltransferase